MYALSQVLHVSRYISKNNCQTDIFGHVFVMTFAKRLKFEQTYRVVYGQSLVVNRAVAQICLSVYGTLRARWVCGGRGMYVFTYVCMYVHTHKNTYLTVYRLYMNYRR
jgi:hypothetical protein